MAAAVVVASQAAAVVTFVVAAAVVSAVARPVAFEEEAFAAALAVEMINSELKSLFT